MSSKRKKLLKTLFTANVGCGCSKPKLSDVFDPKPIPKPTTSDFVLQNPSPFSSSSNEEKDEGYTSTTISCNMDNTTATSTTANSESETETRASKMANSIAITMESNNPYRDFKDSMLQMVLEKRIYAKDNLEELLNCFLKLNSPCHHYFIPKRTGESRPSSVLSAHGIGTCWCGHVKSLNSRVGNFKRRLALLAMGKGYLELRGNDFILFSRNDKIKSLMIYRDYFSCDYPTLFIYSLTVQI